MKRLDKKLMKQNLDIKIDEVFKYKDIKTIRRCKTIGRARINKLSYKFIIGKLDLKSNIFLDKEDRRVFIEKTKDSYSALQESLFNFVENFVKDYMEEHEKCQDSM